MLKDINSWQKIIFSLTTLDHVYSIFIANHCRPCFSDVLSAEYGYGQRVEPEGTKLWDILTLGIYSYCHLPFNPCQTRASNHGQQWAQGPTRLHTWGVPQIQQYLHFSELSATVTFLQPLLRCLNLLILLHVFCKADKETPAVLVCVNLTFLLMLLLLVPSSPSLTIVFYCCLQIQSVKCVSHLPPPIVCHVVFSFIPSHLNVDFFVPKHPPQRSIILIPKGSIWIHPS